MWENLALSENREWFIVVKKIRKVESVVGDRIETSIEYW